MMSSMKKKAASIFMFGALAALLTGGCVAEVGEEGTTNEEGVQSTEQALQSEDGASTEAGEAGDDSSTDNVIRRPRRSGDLCEQFCQAEYIDCMGFGPRAGGYHHRLPGHLGESPCHQRLRRCIRRCYYWNYYER